MICSDEAFLPTSATFTKYKNHYVITNQYIDKIQSSYYEHDLHQSRYQHTYESHKTNFRNNKLILLKL